MREKYAILACIFLIMALTAFSGCIQVSGENDVKKTNITVPGHDRVYEFSYDIREALNVSSNDPEGIRQLVSSSDRLYIVFDGSSAEDNAYSTIVLFNIVSKLPFYFANEGKIWKSGVLYYIGDQWYNNTGNMIYEPALGTTLWVLGPNTGANETSVNLEGNIIYLQGTSSKDMELAGDKFALIVMGINDINQVLTG